MTADKQAGWPARIWAAFGGGLVGAVGLALVGGGGWLLWLGGSPYYLLAGAGILLTAGLLVRRHPAAGLAYATVLAATLIWAIWEAGFVFWPLLPRLLAPAVLGLFILLVIAAAPKGRLRMQSALSVAGLAVACVAVLGAAVPDTFKWGQAEVPAQVRATVPSATGASDWRYYGRDAGGSRFAPVDQINRENVDELKVAWTFRTGEKPNRGSQDQNTPVQVGDKLYVCTPTNIVIALDADTGKELWRHDPKVKPFFWNRCRGVGYWDGAEPPLPAAAAPIATAKAGARPAAKATPAAKGAAPLRGRSARACSIGLSKPWGSQCRVMPGIRDGGRCRHSGRASSFWSAFSPPRKGKARAGSGSMVLRLGRAGL